MIVLGADTHKRSHTVAADAVATGELLGEQTVKVGRRGFDALLQWGSRESGALRGVQVKRVLAVGHVFVLALAAAFDPTLLAAVTAVLVGHPCDSSKRGDDRPGRA